MPKKKGKAAAPSPVGDKGTQDNMKSDKDTPGKDQQTQQVSNDNFDFDNFKESLSDFFDCKTSSVAKVSDMWGGSESESRGKCSYCSKDHDDLKKCTECKTVSYCGRACQKADWSQHKILCRKNKRGDETGCAYESTTKGQGKGSSSDAKEDSKHSEEGGACFYCNTNKDDLKKCVRCKTAAYCDKQCQTADWPEHKKLCGQMHNGKENTMSSNNAHSTKGKSVASSPNMSYSSTREDESTTADAKITSCLFCEKSRRNLIKCPNCKIAKYCDERCRANHRLKHKVVCENYPKFFDAMEKTSEIIADFHNCTSTEMVFPPSPHPFLGDLMQHHGVALLVQITESDFHPFRHSVIVQDLNGEKARMIFYHEKSEELALLPKKLGGMLTPGNFIRWFCPKWHFFLDGTVGFRIETLGNVEILRTVTQFTFSPR